MEVLVPGQVVPERMAKRITNPKARDDKRSLTLKGQEAFVPSQGVPYRIAKRIPNPKSQDEVFVQGQGELYIYIYM